MDTPPGRGSTISGSAGQAKRELRARCRMLRDGLGQASREDASRRICERIQHWSAFPSTGVVFIYLPMRGEVDLRPLTSLALNVHWAIPRVIDAPVRHLIFHTYQSDRLIPHRYGMLEPDPWLPEIPPEQADLIIVPGLAFDRHGYRLGYGGGYYDRLLAHPGLAPTLGACYQALILNDLPRGLHDVPVRYIVTETLGVVSSVDTP